MTQIQILVINLGALTFCFPFNIYNYKQKQSSFNNTRLSSGWKINKCDSKIASRNYLQHNCTIVLYDMPNVPTHSVKFARKHL